MNLEVGVIATVDQVGDEVTIPAINLILSERNLKTLLANVDSENGYQVSRFIPEQGIMMLITVEKNEVHYAERQAGLMDENTEIKLAEEELQNDEPLYVPESFTE